MNLVKETFETILVLIGFFALVYAAAYFVELAKQKVRRKLKVCDNCFEKIKKMQS